VCMGMSADGHSDRSPLIGQDSRSMQARISASSTAEWRQSPASTGERQAQRLAGERILCRSD
jgi:hypothetical protein